jgi:hypothetical protein
MEQPRFRELSASAQAAYAQAFDAVLSRDVSRSVGNLNGSFVSKSVKGATYWYFQYTDISGDVRQIYVGPESDAVRELVKRGSKEARHSLAEPIERLARSAIALGNTAIIPRHLRVISRLAEYGFFQAGGVLIGTHAFLAYGNMFGVAWAGSDRTQDVDFAHAGKNVALALPANIEVDAHAAVDSLKMGFIPLADVAAKSGGGYVVPKDPDFRLDFLTTLHRGGQEPYEHPQLKVTLQPLKFMELSLEDITQGALLADSGAVLVNLPDPARFALHKVIVAPERSKAFSTKARKDMQQAAALIELLRDRRPGDLDAVWSDLISRGPGWRTRAKDGLAALDKVAPDLGIKSLFPFRGAGKARKVK